MPVKNGYNQIWAPAGERERERERERDVNQIWAVEMAPLKKVGWPDREKKRRVGGEQKSNKKILKKKDEKKKNKNKESKVGLVFVTFLKFFLKLRE
jgi:hypothetical protein